MRSSVFLTFLVCVALSYSVFGSPTTEDYYYFKIARHNWYPGVSKYVVSDKCINITNDRYYFYNFTHAEHRLYYTYDDCYHETPTGRDYYLSELIPFIWYGQPKDMDLDGLVQYGSYRTYGNERDIVDQITVNPVGPCHLVYYNQSARYTLVNNGTAIIEDWFSGVKCDRLETSTYMELNKWLYNDGNGQAIKWEYNASALQYIVVMVAFILFLI